MPSPSEPERIRREYADRARRIAPDFYAFDRDANLFMLHGRERALRDLLAREGCLPLTERRLLEIGCGGGEWFPTFQRLGAAAERIAGIDLQPDRVEAARRVAPAADLREGDASKLPWSDATFDVVFQSTVFSSILDTTMRREVAAEMLRVLRPGGVIVWYDLAVDNPFNPAVRGLSRREVGRLFPSAALRSARVTLAPPLARRLVPISWVVSSLLEATGILNTHLLATLRPAPVTP